MNKKKLFSLVELIVVVSIMSIFSVIAVLVLTKWISKSRDSSRINDIQVISKSLKMYFSQNPTYPLPDSYTMISSGSYIFTYQWKAATGVTNILKEYLKEVLKDPSTKQFYDYVVDYYRQNFQLMTFLENDISKASISSKVYAQNNKYVYTEWDEIGFLLTWENTSDLLVINSTWCGIIEIVSGNTYYFVKNRNILLLSGIDIYDYFIKKDIWGKIHDCEGVCGDFLFRRRKVGNTNNFAKFFFSNIHPNLVLSLKKNGLFYVIWKFSTTSNLLPNKFWSLLFTFDTDGNVLWFYLIYFKNSGIFLRHEDIYISKDKKLYLMGFYYDNVYYWNATYSGNYIMKLWESGIEWVKLITWWTIYNDKRTWIYKAKIIGEDKDWNIYFYIVKDNNLIIFKIDKNWNIISYKKIKNILRAFGAKFLGDSFFISFRGSTAPYYYIVEMDKDLNILSIKRINLTNDNNANNHTSISIIDKNNLVVYYSFPNNNMYIARINNDIQVWWKKLSLIVGYSYASAGYKFVSCNEDFVIYGNLWTIYLSKVKNFIIGFDRSGNIKYHYTLTWYAYWFGSTDLFTDYIIRMIGEYVNEEYIFSLNYIIFEKEKISSEYLSSNIISSISDYDFWYSAEEVQPDYLNSMIDNTFTVAELEDITSYFDMFDMSNYLYILSK